MIVKPFSQAINPEKVFALQNQQYSERLLLADTVPANSTKLGKVNVSNLGHFFCMFVTGSYTTLYDNAGNPGDNGVVSLSGQLIDGAGQRKLFNDHIPLNLWLSPGRRKDLSSAGVLTDPVGNNLFYPIELEYLFTANSDILLEVVNNSDNDNEYEICFHGIRIISNMVVKSKISAMGKPFKKAANQPARRG